MAKSKYYECLETELVKTDILKSIAQSATKLKPHEDTVPIDENMFLFKFIYCHLEDFSSFGRTKGLLIMIYKKLLVPAGLVWYSAASLRLGYSVKARALTEYSPIYEAGFRRSCRETESPFYGKLFREAIEDNSDVLKELKDLAKEKISPLALRKILYKPYKDKEEPKFKIII